NTSNNRKQTWSSGNDSPEGDCRNPFRRWYNAMNTVLQATNLTKRYKNGKGIEGITLSLQKGEVFGLVGPNGACKTTILKTVSGLLRADAGDIVIGGHTLRTDFERAMQTMGCLIESPYLYENFSAYHNLQFHARLYTNVGTERIRTVLEKVGLSEARYEKVK